MASDGRLRRRPELVKHDRLPSYELHVNLLVGLWRHKKTHFRKTHLTCDPSKLVRVMHWSFVRDFRSSLETTGPNFDKLIYCYTFDKRSLSSFFHNSSNAASHCNLPVLITDHYTSLRWVYQSTRRISLFPVSVAAKNKKMSLSNSYSQGTLKPILHQLSLLVSCWLWPFDCCIVRTFFFWPLPLTPHLDPLYC